MIKGEMDKREEGDIRGVIEGERYMYKEREG